MSDPSFGDRLQQRLPTGRRHKVVASGVAGVRLVIEHYDMDHVKEHLRLRYTTERKLEAEKLYDPATWKEKKEPADGGADGEYSNAAVRQQKDGNVWRYELDLWDYDADKLKEPPAWLNRILAGMVKPTPEREGVWGKRCDPTDKQTDGGLAFGEDGSAKVPSDPGFYQTEEIVLKFHLYCRRKSDAKCEKVYEVRSLLAGGEPPDKKAEFDKVRQMRGKTMEPGINNVVILLVAGDTLEFSLDHVWIDGERVR